MEAKDEQPRELNLCEILKDCPKGETFWSPLLGDVNLFYIDEEAKNIKVLTKSGFTWNINRDGTITINGEKSSEIMLYPSREQRDWTKVKYESKKERFDPKTLKAFDKILSRNVCDEKWTCDFVSHLSEGKNIYGDVRIYVTGVGNTRRYSIPYNDETKHLVGMTDEAPDFYKYWED